MATPRVNALLTASWTNVSGAAAGVAAMTWQNLGPGDIYIAFTAAAPTGGATDAVHLLRPDDAYFDQTGSAAIWARAETAGARLSGTSN